MVPGIFRRFDFLDLFFATASSFLTEAIMALIKKSNFEIEISKIFDFSKFLYFTAGPTN